MLTVHSSDLEADVSCLKQCQSHYGLRTWLAGHRWGETGFNNPNTEDINSEYILDHVKKDYADLVSQPTSVVSSTLSSSS